MRIRVTLYLTCMQLLIMSCFHKAVPDECLYIEPTFSSIIYSIAKRDTVFFKNNENELRTFVIQKFDSVTVNSTRPLSGPPYKAVSLEYNELLRPLSALRRNNEMFVGKSGCSSKSNISIKFENMWFYDSILLKINQSIITSSDVQFKPTYILKNPDSAINADDVRFLYLSESEGIMGFETGKGDKWISTVLRNH